VLIVEDELLVAWHLETLARDQHLEVCGMVPDGSGAIEQADDLKADLILMDIRLAGRMDGIEAARRIHETRGTPIIFITAHGDPATSAHIERLVPGSPVLAKPISADHLREAVSSVLKSRAG
jgi:DNA-binding NarL/FixJ family response regulator